MNNIGLTSSEARDSRLLNGRNTLPEPEPATFWKEFIESFKDPMIIMLLTIAGMMIGMFFFGYAEIYDPVGIIVTVCIVATVTAKTGVSSDTKYRELKNSVKKDVCKVYRDGNVTEIQVDDVVKGDKVLLQAGNKIPADGILISGKLSVDNSALNGEAEECYKTAADRAFSFPTQLTGDTFVDNHSLFRGAVVFDGEGILDVVHVGVDTVAGKMAVEMQEEDIMSPLKVKLAKLANQISMFGKIGAVVITIMYVIFDIYTAGGLDPFLQQGAAGVLKDLMNAVSLAAVIVVCAVPEGLPLMIALVLMQNTSKMLDHNVLVRKAIGIETAGSLNILFSDKTGTITKGQLEVVEFFTGEAETITDEEMVHNDALQEQISLAVTKTADAMYDTWHKVIGGNATDQAMLKYIGEECFNSYKNNVTYEIVRKQGFNSTNKFSQAQVSNCTYYKGAPEKLIEAASRCLSPSGDIVDYDKVVLKNKIDVLASDSKRVLALAFSNSPMQENKLNDDLVLIGFVAIRDDVRPEAVSAIRDVRNAGIQVVMITGDRLETAKAIARDAGLLKDAEDVAISSAMLNDMSDDEVKEMIPRIRVIARALPTDKSRMVRLCQEMNLVVGMTGDGVNDSPALKRADVGFAMGSGTEAAKEAGKIVILDDNFRSIKDAVLYGRTIYHNILKFCTFQLVINVSAVVVSALSPFLGIVEPLKVTHLLFVNLVMDGLGAMMLGNEPAKAEYMSESPRRRDESIVSKKMVYNIGFTALFFVAMSFFYLKFPLIRDMFTSDMQHKTGYFIFFIACALFNGFNVRDEGVHVFSDLNLNKSFIKIQAIIIVVQLAVVYSAEVPLELFKWIGNMFSCTPISPIALLVTFGMAIFIIPASNFVKTVSYILGYNKEEVSK